MTKTSDRRLLHRTAAAVLVAVTLAGCTSGGGEQTSEGVSSAQDGSAASPPLASREVAPQAPDSAAVGGKPAATQPASLLSRDVIQTANVSVRSRDVGEALVRVRALVAGAQGLVADEHTTTGRSGDPRRSVLTLRVPSTAFDAVLRDIDDLGRVASQQVSTQDVSTQVVDVEARIVSAERVLRRIRGLLESANSFSDVLSLEAELARREADLASLRAQQAYLEDQTSMSTITLSLQRTSAPPAPPKPEPAGFVAGLGVGWDFLAGLVTGALTGLGVLVPMLVLLVPVALLVWWLVRVALRRVPGRQPAEEPPAA
ncbi:MAG TPA: DUF4349 domain-containing protein [Nocardioidaceae bacterium]|nr:DUF4349 domain-containing protein [Nocardioidaceae bacterium]